jgi:hypothetical protein
MAYLGDVHLGDTIDFKFTTVATTGVPTALAGSPILAAYPDNGTTELTAGITLSTSFDTYAGLNNARIVATAGNGFAVGNYALVLTAGTVGGVSVAGYTVGHFSVDKRFVIDGLSLPKAIEALIAVCFGVAAPSGSTVAFKRRDGTTTSVTVTYGTTDGERTGSAIT